MADQLPHDSNRHSIAESEDLGRWITELAAELGVNSTAIDRALLFGSISVGASGDTGRCAVHRIPCGYVRRPAGGHC